MSAFGTKRTYHQATRRTVINKSRRSRMRSAIRKVEEATALAPDCETRKEINFLGTAPNAIRIVDCNQSVAILSRASGISPSAIVMRLARSHDDDSCLLRSRAATGTPFLRAEEFMHNERVIAHSVARTLSWQRDIAPFFICCFAHQIGFARVSHSGGNVNR